VQAGAVLSAGAQEIRFPAPLPIAGRYPPNRKRTFPLLLSLPFRPSRPLAALSLLVSCTLTPSPAAGDGPPRIRTTDSHVRALVDEGRARSRTFNELYETLLTQPVIVFVSCNWFLPSDTAGRSRLVTSSGGYRYVHVEYSCALRQRQRLPILAHELQHAREIGESDAIDDDSMAEVFEDIGFQTQSDGMHRGYETQAARDVQRRVADELDE
jgi:hypothetical protein